VSGQVKRVVDDTYEEISVRSWDSARRELQRFNSAWAFRGHAESGWVLETSLEREPDFKGARFPLEVAEDRMLRDFQRRAHHFIAGPLIPRDDLEWLAMMQHYGAPTRLLDWTRSPFVAAYFALERAAGDRAAVWCVQQEWCLAASRQILRAAHPELLLMVNPSDKDVFENYIRPGDLKLVVPVEPFRLNERMTTQQGLFTCAGDANTSFLDNLRALGPELPKKLVKIEISTAVRAEALEELNQVNINRATLFPGIDGLAQSLKYRLVHSSPLSRAMRSFGVRD
jgi:hypothetical protein